MIEKITRALNGHKGPFGAVFRGEGGDFPKVFALVVKTLGEPVEVISRYRDITVYRGWGYELTVWLTPYREPTTWELKIF